jgi:hypothetical protein
MDELKRRLQEADDASWDKSKMHVMYLLDTLVEKQKAQDDAINGLKLKAAVWGALLGFAGGLVPLIFELWNHISIK